jgi:flavin-dependent dehydrogenase
MVVDRSTDVLVIGGGPAGLATAIEARLAGFETLVIDRRRPPIDVACGEGLMPIGVERLGGLGVEIPEDEGAVFRGIRYLDGDLVAEARFTNGVGLGIRRTTLHEAMRRRAEELGVEFEWGMVARRVTGDGVETARGAIRSRWLAAADGRMSRMRNLAGLSGKDPRRRRFGVRRHYALAPWSDLVEVYWADHVEAYVTPVGPSTVGVAVLSSRTPVDFDRLVDEFPALRARLEGPEPRSRDRGAGPFGHRAAAVVRENLALVGDASGSLDPITGEGLSIAFRQADALIRSLERGNIEQYEVAHRRILRGPRMLTGLLLFIERQPILRRRIIRAFASLPSLFSYMVEIAASGRLPWEHADMKPPRSAPPIARSEP